MRKTLEEFKAFAMRGNVIDVAIGVVIATAFQKIIESLVNNVIMPLLGILTGGNNLSSLSYTFHNSVLSYGMFLQAILDFMIVAFALFLTIKVITRLRKQYEESAAPAEPSKHETLLT